MFFIGPQKTRYLVNGNLSLNRFMPSVPVLENYGPNFVIFFNKI